MLVWKIKNKIKKMKIKNKNKIKGITIIATFMLMILLASIIPATFVFAGGKGEPSYNTDCEITLSSLPPYSVKESVKITVDVITEQDKVKKVRVYFVKPGEKFKPGDLLFDLNKAIGIANQYNKNNAFLPKKGGNYMLVANLYDGIGFREENILGNCAISIYVNCKIGEDDSCAPGTICEPDTPIGSTGKETKCDPDAGKGTTDLPDDEDKMLDNIKIIAPLFMPRFKGLPPTFEFQDIFKKEEKIKKDITMSKNPKDLLTDEEKEAEKKLTDEQKKAKTNKEKALAVVDPIDRFFTIVSAIRGVWVGWVLARKAGTCDVEEPWTDDKSVCSSCNDVGMFCTAERCRILGTSCKPAPTEDEDRVVCVKAECLTSGRPKVTNIDAEAYVDLSSGPVKKASITVSGYLNTEGGIEISDWKNGGDYEIPWDVTKMIIDIKTQAQSEQTDPPVTQCRWSYEKSQGYDTMESFDIETFAEDHTLTLDINGLATNQDYVVWIKCKDVCGAVPAPEENPYWIKFKIAEEPDWVAPCYPNLPTAHENGKCFIDPYNVYVPADLHTQEVKFWLDEKGSCRYSTSYETDVPNFTTVWDDMHEFNEIVSPIIKQGVTAAGCFDNLECLGYEIGSSEYDKCTHCNTFLNLDDGLRIDLTLTQEELQIIDPTLSQEEIQDILDLMDMFGYTGEVGMFRLMIVCQDEQHNEAEPYFYTLLTMPPYDLVIEQPMDPLEDEYDLHPPINVTTSHDTECKYAVQNLSGSTVKAPPWDDMTFIDDNYATEHLGNIIEELIGLQNGKKYKFWAKCHDEGRLEVENHTEFTILKDVLAPIVIRMYHASDTTYGAFGDNLVIETNEEAECVYGTSKDIKCKFNFSDGTAFTKDTEGFLHSAYWQLDNLYYIKCKDKWGNYPGRDTGQSTPKSDGPYCTTIINPYEVPAI